ncbi:MAG TPA: EamA family transporter [Burkholderiaceae bacterium]|nr:EamA family transporter [Burkholderiaceae bacterium]
MRSPVGPLAAVSALLFNAFTWGVSWWPLRQLQALGVHPLWSTALIYAVVAAALVLWRPAAVRDLCRTPGLWVLLLASGLTNASFNWGVTVGDVVRVVLLFYLMPMWSVVLARWLLREPLHVGVLLRALLAVTGALVVLWPSEGGWPWPRQGADWLGLVGGLSFALNTVMLRREAGRPASSRALAMFAGGAGVSAIVALAAAGIGVASPPWGAATGWGPWVLLMALWFMASNLSLQIGAAHLHAATTAVVMVSEVVFASVSAVALGAATLQPRTVAGGLLIAAAALLAAWQERPRDGAP